jgi:hypothetical protein
VVRGRNEVVSLGGRKVGGMSAWRFWWWRVVVLMGVGTWGYLVVTQA